VHCSAELTHFDNCKFLLLMATADFKAKAEKQKKGGFRTGKKLSEVKVEIEEENPELAKLKSVKDC